MPAGRPVRTAPVPRFQGGGGRPAKGAGRRPHPRRRGSKLDDCATSRHRPITDGERKTHGVVDAKGPRLGGGVRIGDERSEDREGSSAGSERACPAERAGCVRRLHHRGTRAPRLGSARNGPRPCSGPAWAWEWPAPATDMSKPRRGSTGRSSAFAAGSRCERPRSGSSRPHSSRASNNRRPRCMPSGSTSSSSRQRLRSPTTSRESPRGRSAGDRVGGGSWALGSPVGPAKRK